MQGKYDPPVKGDDIVDLEVISIGEKGDPIAKIDKYVVFIKESTGVQVGDVVKCKIKNAGDKFGFAEPVQEGETTDEEVEPEEST